MANPSGFPQANVTLGPPPGYADAVVPLPVCRLPAGQLVSCWELTALELEEIARTGKIYLSVWGGLTQPPVQVSGFLDPLLEA